MAPPRTPTPPDPESDDAPDRFSWEADTDVVPLDEDEMIDPAHFEREDENPDA